MKSNYKKLGDYIQQVNIKNENSEIDNLLGVSISKKLIPSIANIIGTDMSKYKIIQKGQFAYGPVTSRNGDKISISIMEDESAIVSTSYIVFDVIKKDELLPEYLMMWFRRSEFDRYARYKSHGSTREVFDWEEMCEVQLPIPSLQKQKEIVQEYQAVTNRIALNEKLNTSLEDMAQTIYKEWFVNFEFPNEQGKPYKSSGGEMVYCEELEKEIPLGWEKGILSDIVMYSKDRIVLSKLNLNNYISTENMIANRRGVEKANSLPDIASVSNFKKHDILISNIRPYFKKIWLAEFDGGCSNDILCIKPKENPFFLYFTMEQDKFFDYIMTGAKGTKMPRGDKDWILKYPLIIPSKEELEKFSRIVTIIKKEINKKMETTRKLNLLLSALLSKMASLEE